MFVVTEKPMDGTCELLKNVKHNCWEILMSDKRLEMEGVRA